MMTHRLRAFIVIALCGGCASGNAPKGLGDSPTVGGQIQDWRGLVATPVVYAGNFLASGYVDSVGNFSITLPGAAELSTLLSPPAFSMDRTGCTGRITFLPSTVRSVVAEFGVSNRGTVTSTMSLNHQSKSVLYVFFDQDAAAQGTLSCPNPFTGMSQTLTENITVSKGWNNLLAEDSAVNPSRTITAPSGVLPEELRWTLGSLGNSSGSLCLANVECSSTVCQPDNTCACIPPRGLCQQATDCCAGTTCNFRQCCNTTGQPCQDNPDCCSNSCSFSGICN